MDADRLYKLRHCMDIEGAVRQLPLFEPPIDPALLVRAAAAGVDLDTVLNDANAPLPHYRFTTMAQKATELCADVKALGGALLAALEKEDAEKLAELRSGNEVDLLKAIRDVKQKQIEEAKAALDALNKYKDVVTARQTYYSSRPYVNIFEVGHLASVAASLPLMGVQVGTETVAAFIHVIPDTKLGAPPTMGATFGGSNIAGAFQAFGSSLGVSASILNSMGSLSATMGGFDRRQDDWNHQADLATKELLQVAKQIAAAEIRVAIAESELANQDTQIEQSKGVHDLLRTKFTNRALYQWMTGQISALYFQAYQLAYDMARKAERTYQFERSDFDARFIQFGAWDGMKKAARMARRVRAECRDASRDPAVRLRADRRCAYLLVASREHAHLTPRRPAITCPR